MAASQSTHVKESEDNHVVDWDEAPVREGADHRGLENNEVTEWADNQQPGVADNQSEGCGNEPSQENSQESPLARPPIVDSTAAAPHPPDNPRQKSKSCYVIFLCSVPVVVWLSRRSVVFVVLSLLFPVCQWFCSTFLEIAVFALSHEETTQSDVASPWYFLV